MLKRLSYPKKSTPPTCPATEPSMAEIVASDHILHQAYQWLCKARQDYSPNADAWDLRHHWDRQKPIIQQQILTGTYRVSPMIRLEIDGEVKTFWGAADDSSSRQLRLCWGKRSSRISLNAGI